MAEAAAEHSESVRGRLTGARWWAWYRTYLRSEAWAALRAKVLARAQGRCEGCAAAKASDVHHLTYAHAGAEFLFELVALCRPCHVRWHKWGKGGGTG
jgi:5-methylcytosine-specific restriction endonuclease McrA